MELDSRNPFRMFKLNTAQYSNHCHAEVQGPLDNLEGKSSPALANQPASSSISRLPPTPDGKSPGRSAPHQPPGTHTPPSIVAPPPTAPTFSQGAPPQHCAQDTTHRPPATYSNGRNLTEPSADMQTRAARNNKNEIWPDRRSGMNSQATNYELPQVFR